MPVWLLLLIYALATASLTGLIVTDDITAPARGAFLRRLDLSKPVHAWFAGLVGCQWCTSFWVALLGTAPLSYWHLQAIAPLPSWPGNPFLLIPALTLAYRQVTGMMSGLGRG